MTGQFVFGKYPCDWNRTGALPQPLAVCYGISFNI